MEIYIDEAGRGPLAWPLYVGLILPLKKNLTNGFKDSKVLSEKKREELYAQILKLRDDWKLLFASGNVTNTVIDKKWLTKSINFSVRKAITKMAWHDVSSCSKRSKVALAALSDNVKCKIENVKLVIDWKHDFHLWKDLNIDTETIVHGDALNVYISMASILQKLKEIV